MKAINTISPFIGIAESRIGGRSENQDTCAWQDTPHGLLILICDGMGGGPSGKYASRTAADIIVNYVLDSKPTSDRRDVLVRAIREASQKLFDAQSSNPSLRGMGTTVAALLINKDSAVVAHVGDTRVYQLRGTHKVFRTFDHSHVFELVRAKAITEEEARLSAECNVITQALGPMEKISPSVEILPYEKGDRFMICSDGIWNALNEKELIKIAGGTKSLSGAVESLVIKVDEIGRGQGGTHDNLTVTILQTPFNSKLKYKMSTKVKYTLYALAALCCISLLANFIQYKVISRNNTEVGVEVSDSVVTKSDLEKKLTEEREKYREQLREQDEYYRVQIEKLSKMVHDSDKDSISTEVKLIQQINELIGVMEKLKEAKTMKEASGYQASAKEKIENIQTTVNQLKISGKELKKSITWINNPITKDVNNKKRPKHLTDIIDNLESLKQEIQKKSGKS